MTIAVGVWEFRGPRRRHGRQPSPAKFPRACGRPPRRPSDSARRRPGVHRPGTSTDVLLERASSLLLHGKGRKERVVPLWKSTAAQLRAWLPCIDRRPDAPVFPNRAGKPLSRSGVEYQLRVACRKAAKRHPALARRRISPHTLRHTTAMHLLQSGVDITVIALWLGHEDTATTHHYVEADLAMKEPTPVRRGSRTAAAPLYRHRPLPRLPGSPLTMRSTAPPDRPRPREPPSELRIVLSSA